MILQGIAAGVMIPVSGSRGHNIWWHCDHGWLTGDDPRQPVAAWPQRKFFDGRVRLMPWGQYQLPRHFNRGPEELE